MSESESDPKLDLVPIVFKIGENNAIPIITVGGHFLPLNRFKLEATCDNVQVTMDAAFGSTEVSLVGYFISSVKDIKLIYRMIDLEENKTQCRVNQKEFGIYKKYIVARTDNSDYPGGKHHGCEYFVLDLNHDKFAKAAIKAYAEACQDEYPMLYNDLMLKVTTMP